jgi:hypothetical protein
MKRRIFGIALGFGISLLFFLTAQAFAVRPGLWTLAAAGTMGAFNVIVWSGFGRALYDVFVSRDYS